MIKAIWEGNSPYSKFLISVGIILLSAIFFTILGGIFVRIFFSLSMDELTAILKDASNPAFISINKMMQGFSAFGAFVVPPFILAYLFSHDPISFLSLDKNPARFSYFIAIAIMIVALPFVNHLGELNSHMHLPGFLKSVEEWMKTTEEKAAEITNAFLNNQSVPDVLINLVVIALLPAVGEELLFRGVVQKIFFQWSKNTHVAVWVTAILFSALHMQFYGFLPRMILGGMLGYMLVWSRSLWLPIVAHFVNNAVAVVLLFLYQKGSIEINPDTVGTESEMGSVLISFLLMIVLLFVLQRRNVPKTAAAQS